MQVLWMDSDNMPLRDPAVLFDSPTFREHGALFWCAFCVWFSVATAC